MIWFHWNPRKFPLNFFLNGLYSLDFKILFYNKVFINLLHNLDFRFFYNKYFINFLINLYIFFFDFYIFFKKFCFFSQHAIHLLMVEHMTLQNNSSVNFLDNNNLISYMIKVHHNPKDKIWCVASFSSLTMNGFCLYHSDSIRLY